MSFPQVLQMGIVIKKNNIDLNIVNIKLSSSKDLYDNTKRNLLSHF